MTTPAPLNAEELKPCRKCGALLSFGEQAGKSFGEKMSEKIQFDVRIK
jgi:hypothetical protein